MPTVADELKSLRIERNEPASRLPGWAGPAIAVVVVLVVLGAAWKILAPRIFVPEVETTAVSLVSPAQAQQLLVATGYVVAAIFAGRPEARALGPEMCGVPMKFGREVKG